VDMKEHAYVLRGGEMRVLMNRICSGGRRLQWNGSSETGLTIESLRNISVHQLYPQKNILGLR